ncbi:MAG: CAAX prenyl protease-related protein [Sulfurimonas sp.]|nr:CAAX prenyl protease-related protein [Sulfurimonas sp.]
MNIRKLQQNNTFTRVAPFALFMVFIALEEALRNPNIKDLFHFSDSVILCLYPIKALSTGLLILMFRRNYTELHWQDLGKLPATLLSLAVGIIVFILWIQMDWPWATIGTSGGYNPTLMSENFTYYLLIVFRIVGAALIVPIMEELFWRSWLLRYLISKDFQCVEIGRFSLSSFLIGAIMFGLEHNLWLAGIMAGVCYNILLYRTRSIAQCILAHAVTNFMLGLYVLQTGRWEFW